MTVPRRQINTELQAILAAGLRKLLHHVAPTVLVRRMSNGVVGELRRPKTETVVVLTSEYHLLHASLAQYAGPLLAVDGRGTEVGGRSRAVAPLQVVKGVHSEMNERNGLTLLPFHLIRCWHGGYRGRGFRPVPGIYTNCRQQQRCCQPP